MTHKDKYVRVLTALCLAHILCLDAPDHPFSVEQLENICSLFLHQIALVFNTEGPFYLSYFQLFDLLNSHYCGSIITELDDADELMLDFCNSAFNSINQQTPSNLFEITRSFIFQMISSAQSIPFDFVKTLLLQTQKNLPEQARSKDLAIAIIKSSCTKLHRHVAHYFSEMLVHDFEDDDDDQEPLKKKGPSKSIIAAHSLIVTLNSIAPELLMTVIPQLEEEMTIDIIKIRVLALETVTSIIISQSSQFISQWPNVWRIWSERFFKLI